MQRVKTIIELEWKRIEGMCPECEEKARDLHKDHARRQLLHKIGASGKRVCLDFPNLRLILKSFRESIRPRTRRDICMV